MSKKTLGLIGGLLVVTVVLLVIALSTERKKLPTIPTEKVTPTPIAHTFLSLSPNPVTVSQNGAGSVDVIIDTDKDKASGYQLEMTYDPEALTNVQIKQAGLFANALPLTPINKVDQATGRITFAVGISPAQDSIAGKGTIATITFNKKPGTSESQTTIQILPQTVVTDLERSSSVLKESSNTTILLSSQ
ncbi:MAG: hypothetical protein HY430_00245 [Candidatus Levybacteria bacterium]|nr:hypothetical protein [Candidatus Levybacteria bacterium]